MIPLRKLQILKINKTLKKVKVFLTKNIKNIIKNITKKKTKLLKNPLISWKKDKAVEARDVEEKNKIPESETLEQQLEAQRMMEKDPHVK